MNVVAFDTETKGLRWYDPAERAFLASWADAGGEYHADLADPQHVELFINALDRADTIVAHNFSFDAHQVRETLGYDIFANSAAKYDTDLMSRVLFPQGQVSKESGTSGHKLKTLATAFLRADAEDAEKEIDRMAESLGLKLRGPKADIGAYYDVWRAYPQAMEHYARMDARYTYDLFELFQAERERAERILDLEDKVMPILVRAEQRGVRLEKDLVVQLHAQYQAKRAVLYEDVSKELGDEAMGGPGSEDALIEALQMQGIPLHRKTEKTGKLATNKFALQEFVKDFPILQKLEEYREAEKFLSTYLGPMQGKDFIHTDFRQIGAWTGRMSSARPNMQNIPVRAGAEVRGVFIPREGCAFVVSDYDSIEARLLAYYLGDAGYRELVAERDPHAWMASMIWGGTPDDYAKGGPNDKKRTLAKNILFAITYGAGKKRVADMLAAAGFPSTEDDAKSLIAKIKSNLPNFYKLNKRIRAKIDAVGHVNTMFGRVSPVKKDKSYVGLNALIQGTAADIMKQGLIYTAEALEPIGWVPLLIVHDEVLSEGPTESAAEAQRLQDAALLRACDEMIPALAVTSSIVTTSYADAK